MSAYGFYDGEREETPSRFFRDLVEPAPETPGLYIGALYAFSGLLEGGRIRQKWTPASHAACGKWVEALEAEALSVQPHTVNFTPCLRSEANSRNSSVAGVTALWADLDNYLWDEWRGKQYKILRGSFLEPSVYVDSGWGVHLYWFLDGYVPLKRPDGRQTPEYGLYCKTSSVLSWFLNADAQCSVNPAHLMRFPGSCNCKSVPYKRGRIVYSGRGRLGFGEFSRMLDGYARDWLAAYEASPAGGERTAAAAVKLKELLAGAGAPAAEPRRGVRAEERLGGSAEGLEAAMRAAAGTCPLLDVALNRPLELRYPEWMALGCALAKLFEYETARELFFRISEPGNTTPDPEGNIGRYFDGWAARGLMPANCGYKLPNISCPKAGNACKSLMTVLRRAWRAAGGGARAGEKERSGG